MSLTYGVLTLSSIYLLYTHATEYYLYTQNKKRFAEYSDFLKNTDISTNVHGGHSPINVFDIPNLDNDVTKDAKIDLVYRTKDDDKYSLYEFIPGKCIINDTKSYSISLKKVGEILDPEYSDNFTKVKHDWIQICDCSGGPCPTCIVNPFDGGKINLNGCTVITIPEGFKYVDSEDGRSPYVHYKIIEPVIIKLVLSQQYKKIQAAKNPNKLNSVL